MKIRFLSYLNLSARQVANRTLVRSILRYKKLFLINEKFEPTHYIHNLDKRQSAEFAIIHAWTKKNLKKIKENFLSLRATILEGEKHAPKLYVYWDKGFELAPDMVKWCRSELLKNHLQDDLIFLDNTSLKNNLDIDFIKIPRRAEAKSDLIRLSMLARCGGAWIDADIFARRNLLDYYVALVDQRADCFAFTDQEKFNFRVGFISSIQGGIIVTELLAALRMLWREEAIFLNYVSYHHLRWLFISLYILDSEFNEAWESSLTRDVKYNYCFSRTMIENCGNEFKAAHCLSDSDLHILTHKYPSEVNPKKLEAALALNASYSPPAIGYKVFEKTS